MATLESIANKNENCGGADANTGTLGCQLGFGTPVSAIKLKKGTVIPKETEFNIAYINGLIALRTATPLMNADGFEELSAEDTMSTSPGGVERLSLKGLVKYKMTYMEGLEFYREMSKITSFKSSDWVFFDESGNMLIATNSDGDFVGFSAGQVNAEKTKRKVQGGDPESKSYTVQLLNRKQTDLNRALITYAKLGFDAQEDIRGVNSATVVFNAVPSDTDVSLDVKVVLDADMTTNVGGLSLPAEFEYTVNETVVALTTVTPVGDSYTLAVPAVATSEVLTIALKSVVTVTGVMFAKGTIATTTVIA